MFLRIGRLVEPSIMDKWNLNQIHIYIIAALPLTSVPYSLCTRRFLFLFCEYFTYVYEIVQFNIV
jgi:hypothetical protein